MDLITYFLLGLLALYVSKFIKDRLKYWNFPPGPPSLPLTGCVPFLPHKGGARNLMASVDWIPQYGDIMGLKFGLINLVFIQEFEKAKELVFDDRFTARWNKSDYRSNVRGINGKNIGVITTNGAEWKNLRTFSIMTMSKYFGSGKRMIENIIFEEVNYALNEFPLKEDFHVRLTFNTSIFNIIWRIVSGQRYDVSIIKHSF